MTAATPRTLARDIVALRAVCEKIPDLTKAASSLSLQMVAAARHMQKNASPLSSNARRLLEDALPETIDILAKAGKDRDANLWVNVAGIQTMLDLRVRSFERTFSHDAQKHATLEALANFLIENGYSHAVPRKGAAQKAKLVSLPLGDTIAPYLNINLPEERQNEVLRGIKGDAFLASYTHDDLIRIYHTRKRLLKMTSRSGLNNKSRPLVSRLARNLRWSGGRVATILVHHRPSWMNFIEINTFLKELAELESLYDRLAARPENDDWLHAKTPEVIEINRKGWDLHSLGLDIVTRISQGPSRDRFDASFYERLPGKNACYIDAFSVAAAPLVNALATQGIAGAGEERLAREHHETSKTIPEKDKKYLTGFSDLLVS